MGHATLPVRQPRRQRLIVAKDWLFATGLSLGQGASGGNLETLVLYALRTVDDMPDLRLIGTRFFAPEDGLWTLALWDETDGELACFFQLLGDDLQCIRVGAPRDMMVGRERIISLDATTRGEYDAVLLDQEKVWLLRSRRGALLGLTARAFKPVAALQGLKACTALACRSGQGCDTLLVTDYSRVFRCSIFK